ncbi:cobyrinate a,c-diamide synthase [Kitasatospora setae]|uniref:Hydrogenobyrinate a,c-diamide synthase n=1 Tax=Kitasatospora setae (strain ATCC 33774 / DSM 43861 / JCM 3304 / KCC A-0304 / NBRC 14216 / KM-6054) TaxID=452652 RepID=E4N083_KITSK|nr:putative cobyrinic acid a,c-diamide synthase [Kitasatospora setae KM-6054]
MIPRLVVAAPSSGAGKTTVATGLIAALAARGLKVSPHKVGPDYIDPGYHALAAGRPGRNLDAWMSGPERIAPLFAHGAAGADVAVVEGVMGLYDGAAGRGELASTAQVAKLLRAPVVLVVDASSQSRSVAALVHGFASWDPEVRLAGVILNKVASDRHETLLREALEEGSGVPVLGAVRRAGAVDTPSRHLGLVPAVERSAEALRAVREMGELVGRSVDLDAVLALARTAPPLTAAPWDAAAEVGPVGEDAAVSGGPAAEGGPVSGGPVAGPRPRIALAGGAAFSFSYAENAELLAAAGAEVVPFDPLHDEELPERTAALVIGGGFPEVYVSELSANAALRGAVAELAAAGAPVVGECAGLLYLGRELDGLPMCGVLDTAARMTPRLTLGYREAVALADSPLAAAGSRVRGHEFHRTATDPAAGPSPAWGWRTPTGPHTEGHLHGSVHASYLHLHWTGAPALPARLVRQAAAWAAGTAGRD